MNFVELTMTHLQPKCIVFTIVPIYPVLYMVT